MGKQILNKDTQEFETLVPMKSHGGTGDRHAKKYFTEKFLCHAYKLASANNILRANTGTEVDVLSIPVKVDGKWQVEVRCSNTDMVLPIHQLFKPRPALNQLFAEDNAFDRLSDQIEDIKSATGLEYVDMKMPTGEQFKIRHLTKVAGFRKADMTLLSFYCIDENYEPVYYISHKKGPNVGDYVSYGSLSGHRDHPVMQDFIKRSANLIGNDHPAKESYALMLDANNSLHKDLMMKVLYGDEFGSEKKSEDNVHAIFYGLMWLQEVSDVYNLNVDHFLPNGAIPEHKLLIQSTRTEDRNDAGLKNTRLMLRREGSRRVSSYV
jgi:hypothetical protein